jgi:hypothetical protein
MQQQDKVKSPFDTASKQDVASQDFLFQPDYFHGELNASEDSLEWQEFALLQQPVNGG